jgi:UDP-N-acetylmuramyl tripeptide synthase
LGRLRLPQVRTPRGKLQIITPLLGKHNASNVLAAVAAGVAMNVPLKAIVAGGRRCWVDLAGSGAVSQSWAC